MLAWSVKLKSFTTGWPWRCGGAHKKRVDAGLWNWREILVVLLCCWFAGTCEQNLNSIIDNH